MALPSCRSSTRSPISACRAGMASATPAPSASDPTNSIQISITPARISTACTAITSAKNHWPATITVLRDSRSATTPPTGARSSIGMPNPRKSAPSAVADCVRSKARNPRATMPVHSAAKFSSVPYHSTRYAGARRAAKVSHNHGVKSELSSSLRCTSVARATASAWMTCAERRARRTTGSRQGTSWPADRRRHSTTYR